MCRWRALALALALALAVAVPASAHDETDPITWMNGLIEVEGALANPESSASVAFADSAQQMLTLLLATEPAECYMNSYIAGWVVFADYYHLSRTAGNDVMTGDVVAAIGELLTQDKERVLDGLRCEPSQ